MYINKIGGDDPHFQVHFPDRVEFRSLNGDYLGESKVHQIENYQNLSHKEILEEMKRQEKLEKEI